MRSPTPERADSREAAHLVVVRQAEGPAARVCLESRDAARIRRLRLALRWEAITRRHHALAIEALRVVKEEAHG